MKTAPERTATRPASEGEEVQLPLERASLAGIWTPPERAKGAVIFAHGSGSSRFSPRNRFVARILRRAGLGTLLLDLLTPGEERLDAQTAHLRFDIAFLANRLVQVTDWLASDARGQGLRLGVFGASTGAAAALAAASGRPEGLHAVVSRGGRPDLAWRSLSRVQAPTLLIVGGRDLSVIRMNREALDELACEKRLEIVPGATHLFEESGALEQVSELAKDWFERFLALGRTQWAQSAS